MWDVLATATLLMWCVSSLTASGSVVNITRFMPQIPKECIYMNYCEAVENYPVEYVEKVLDILKHSIQLGNTIKYNDYDSDDEFELCTSKKRKLFPTAARTETGQWYFILNSESTPVQFVEVEICTISGKCGSDFMVSFHSGYRSSCKQKYMRRGLFGLDRSGEPTVVDTSYPCCCVCEIQHVYSNASTLANTVTDTSLT